MKPLRGVAGAGDGFVICFTGPNARLSCWSPRVNFEARAPTGNEFPTQVGELHFAEREAPCELNISHDDEFSKK